ncbi:MAG: hypothetical protein ONB16_04400 [candidate division KSB1 bacterium]|nr:hypothetical protein [candidate division KSB1 bacterium]
MQQLRMAICRWYIYIVSIFVFMFSADGCLAQQVMQLYEKLNNSFREKNFYTTLNLCRDIISICEQQTEPECWFTNIMKEVYRYKGVSEFEIYKQELKKKRLADAIESLSISYNLYKDPEIQFLSGYLTALKAIADNDRTNLNGLVTAWSAMLSLHARNGWKISADLIDKAKLYVRVAEKFAVPISSKKYSGAFAKFMIMMTCDLMEKDQLSSSDAKYFEEMRQKYFQQSNVEWQKWRSSELAPE